jgi:HK97 family phage major capsid protein
MTKLKKLLERRAELQAQLEKLVSTADTENRAMSEDEIKDFDAAEKEIKEIDETVAREERARNIPTQKTQIPENKTIEERAAEEENAFADFVMGRMTEERAAIQLTQGNNGSIVPTTIANRIITAVRDMVPFLQMADVVNTNGKLSVPVYTEDSTNYINADYVDEGTDLTDNVGKFTTIDLTGYVIGALALVSNKLKDNTDVNVVDFVVQQTARAMAEKLEKEFVNGTASKITGIQSATGGVTAAAAAAVTYDELVSLKHSVKQRFRASSCWIMNPATYTAICKLKDENGQPYFKEDEYKILGLPVIESDSMPTMAAKKKAIIFADLSGYTIKATKSVEIQILREKFATKNMLGVLAFGEYDAKITDAKKFAVLTMAAS